MCQFIFWMVLKALAEAQRLDLGRTCIWLWLNTGWACTQALLCPLFKSSFPPAFLTSQVCLRDHHPSAQCPQDRGFISGYQDPRCGFDMGDEQHRAHVLLTQPLGHGFCLNTHTNSVKARQSAEDLTQVSLWFGLHAHLIQFSLLVALTLCTSLSVETRLGGA